LTTAHELGGAFGVSIFSAVALGAGTVTGAGFASGYSDGAMAGALIAGLLVLVAGLAIPAFRPTAAHQTGMH
jgi:hypothetical protein